MAAVYIRRAWFERREEGKRRREEERRIRNVV